jgi:hypothetical protein
MILSHTGRAVSSTLLAAGAAATLTKQIYHESEMSHVIAQGNR